MPDAETLKFEAEKGFIHEQPLDMRKQTSNLPPCGQVGEGLWGVYGLKKQDGLAPRWAWSEVIGNK